MTYYHVPQPYGLPSPEKQNILISRLVNKDDAVAHLWSKSSQPYLGWDKFSAKYRSGAMGRPESLQDISAEDAWYMMSIRRRLLRQKTLVKVNRENDYFGYYKSPATEKWLHDLDMQLGGNVVSDGMGNEKSKRERYLRQSLVEEAIASSQLEGAATTRQVAKQMLTENKKPKTHGEWMIFNNYQTIRKVEQETSKYSLSREVLLELHILMTNHTLETEKQGRWRKDADEIVVKRVINGEEFTAHVPPKEEVLQSELDRLIAFANDEEDEAELFLHPILKAIILHFWFGYIHPFCDGNGRLARSLFYWYLLRHGYWLISYVPISTVIKKSASAYADSYVYTEQYDNDLTYFVEYNLQKLGVALRQFDDHVNKVKQKTASIDSILPDKNLNDRQKQILHHLLGKPEDYITAQRHAAFHEVAWVTSKDDLKQLEKLGYLVASRQGREVLYGAAPKLLELSETAYSS